MAGGAQLAGGQVGDLGDQGQGAQAQADAAPGGVRPRGGGDAPDPPFQREGRVLPPQQAVGGGEQRGEGGPGVVLGLGTHAAVGDGPQGGQEQTRTGGGQALQEVTAGVGGADGLGQARVDGTGVQALLKPEHAGPGDVVARDKGPLDGGGPAPGGQEGEVQVEPAVDGHLQQADGHDPPVGHDDGDVGLQGADPALDLHLAQGGGGAYLEPGRAGQGGHG